MHYCNNLLGICHFRWMNIHCIYGPEAIHICMSKLRVLWTGRQQRHLAYISKFTIDIKHVEGKHNHAADALSKATIDYILKGVDYEAMAARRKEGSEVQPYRTALSSLQIDNIPLGSKGI